MSHDDTMKPESEPAHLVVDRPKVNVRLHRFARNTAREHIFSSIAKSMINQDPAHIFNLRINRPLAYLQ